jgi:hypothetical protein
MTDYDAHRPDYTGTTTEDWSAPRENDFDTDDLSAIGALPALCVGVSTRTVHRLQAPGGRSGRRPQPRGPGDGPRWAHGVESIDDIDDIDDETIRRARDTLEEQSRGRLTTETVGYVAIEPGSTTRSTGAADGNSLHTQPARSGSERC